MPFTINLYPDRRLIEVKWRVEISDKEPLEAAATLLKMSELAAGYYIFHDLSDVQSFRVSGERLHSVASMVEPISNPTAVLVPSDPFIRGMVVTYESMVNWNRARVRLFTTEAEVSEWLAGQGTAGR